MTLHKPALPIALALLVAGGAHAEDARGRAHEREPRLDRGAGARNPNIVFILTDNLGYGEIGAYGGGVADGLTQWEETTT